MRRAVILLWLLGLPASAWANDPLKEAQRQFRQMEYGKAQEALELALRVADNQPADLVAIYQLQGMCLAAEGQLAEAEQAYARLLSIDPGFRLSARISPKLAEPFNRAQRDLRAEPGIRLEHQPAPDFLSGAEPAIRVTLRADPMGLVRAVRVVLPPAGQAPPRRAAAPINGPGVVVIPLKGSPPPPDSPYWLEALDQHGGVLHRLGAQSPFHTPRETTNAAVAVAPPPKAARDRPTAAEKPTAVRKSAPRITPRRDGVALGFDLDPAKAPPRPAPAKERPVAWYRRWWVWTAVGALALTAIIGTAVAVSNQGGGSDGPVDIGISFGVR